MKIHLVGAELIHRDGRTDGQTDVMKLIVIFHNFVNMPKNDVVIGSRTIFQNVHAFDKNETKQIVKHMYHLKNALSITNLYMNLVM
jgi:hypothetical protein